MWIQAYHNAEGKEEFTDKPAFSLPKKGICKFLDTTYRQYFWDKLKDTSNLPSPETCPIKAVRNSILNRKPQNMRNKLILRVTTMLKNTFLKEKGTNF